MFLATNQYPGDGTTGPWTINFAGLRPDAESGTAPYIDQADVKGYLLVGDYRNPESITPVTLIPQGPTTFLTDVVIPLGTTLVLKRETEARYPLVDYSDVAVYSYDLDLANRQNVYLAMEAQDAAFLATESALNTVAASNEALLRSQQALDNSLAAVTASNAATVTANAADTKSTAAVATANAADAKADAAVLEVAGATTTANAAAAEAAAATLASNTATATANAADTKADQAIVTADAATGTANAADAKSDQALAAATAADSKSDAAVATANAADTKADAAVATANGIEAKADQAIATADDAAGIAQQAMDAVSQGGVQTFNGRAGIVVPEAGDYGSAQIAHAGSTVGQTLNDQAAAISGKRDLVSGNSQVYATDAAGAQGAVQYSDVTTPGIGSIVQRRADQSIRALTLADAAPEAHENDVANREYVGAALAPIDVRVTALESAPAPGETWTMFAEHTWADNVTQITLSEQTSSYPANLAGSDLMFVITWSGTINTPKYIVRMSLPTQEVVDRLALMHGGSPAGLTIRGYASITGSTSFATVSQFNWNPYSAYGANIILYASQDPNYRFIQAWLVSKE